MPMGYLSGLGLMLSRMVLYWLSGQVGFAELGAWGEAWEKLADRLTNPQFNFHDSTGSLLNTIDVSKSFDIYKLPPILCRRVALHNSLKNAALSPDGQGPLVKLVTGARIEDVDVETCTIALGNGEKVVGDLIIGADGVKVFSSDNSGGLFLCFSL